MQLDSIAFEVKDGLFVAKLAGKLTPLFGGLNWPTFDVKELSIDSKGHVHLEGGWLDLPKQYTLDFHGFKIEISKLGFGKTEDGGKWMGFSGGLKLVEGLQAGASVEGLRVTWYADGRKPKITLNGVGVEFEIPEVLSFKGSVAFREFKRNGEDIRQFEGDIELKLKALKMTVDGVLVIGSSTGSQGRFQYFAIYLDADLPTGIPLGTLPLSIYGMAGLFALQMEPDKKPAETWYNLDPSKSYFHRPAVGVTDLLGKWAPRKGSLGLGAGITLGTSSDDGYTFNGKFLLAVVFPGPLIFLQGSCRILEKRTGSGDEPPFRSLAVFDGRESNLLIGIDAKYKKGKKGEMIEISARTEAFFSFTKPDQWHIYIGQRETRDQRVRALFGRFVEANAYFMLDAKKLALGAWYGYDKRWKVGPLSIALQAWAEGNAVVSFKPTQFHGDLWIHGLVELKVFKFGLGLTVDARLAVDLFTPYHVVGELRVEIRLPRPLKKTFGATLRVEFGPKPELPPIPLPLHDVAIEHLKTTVNWPLPRKTLLLPSYDDGGGFIGSKQEDHEPLGAIPVVPLDARPHLMFGRQVQDDALVGVNGQVPSEWETIGDPTRGGGQTRARYSLQHVRLAKKVGNAWPVVASDPKSGVKPYLFGSWAALPPSPGSASATAAQTRLWLWNLNPFSFLRRSGSEWEEWFAEAFPGYPCIPSLSSQEVCFGFEALTPGSVVRSPWTYPGPPAVTLSWDFGPATVRTVRRPVVGGLQSVNVLCFPERAARKGVRIRPAEPGRAFRMVFAREESSQPLPLPVAARLADGIARDTKVISTVDDLTRICVDFRERPAGTAQNPWADQGVRFEVRGADGELLPQGRIERWSPAEPRGLNAGFRLDVILPRAVSWIELIVSHRPPFRVLAFNAGGAVVASHAPGGPGGGGPETVVLTGEGISRLEVHAAGNEKLLHRLCFAHPKPAGPSATGLQGDGGVVGPFFPVRGEIFGEGTDVDVWEVKDDKPFCLERICVTPDPEAGAPVRREERIQHIREELARWTQEAPVLEPDTVYRLEIETQVRTENPSSTRSLTENAYFRTEGPPGLAKLAVPAGADPDKFDSGLADLTRYVKETTPPTVPPPGEKPILYRPFYRAYDIGMEFNEDYVETMYRMDRRDLGLYLYDNNNQPARDEEGRLLALGNRWGKAEALSLSERDTHWVTLVDGASCLPKKLDPQTFPRDSTLASSEPGRVLAADTLYEPRLVPMLLHESFAGLPLGSVPPGWYREDSGPGGPAVWRVGETGEPPSRFVEQISSIGGAGPERPGTLLLLAESSQWTDYRVSVYIRSAAGGAVGVAVRHQGPGTGYRFSLDGRVRRLVKGDGTLLAEDHFAYRKNRDYLVTFEALGPALRVYLDSELVFEATDADFQSGGIGLYACQSPGARFSDVRVDDFRAEAPVVYRFQLTTSLFANFFHHLHSYQDETWKAGLDGSGDPLNEAKPASFDPPSEAEERAYDAVADGALKQAARQNPRQVEVTRLERGGQPVAFLLRSPEPLAWDRVVLALSGTLRHFPTEPPGAVKLVDASFGTLPGDESVTLLLREAVDLSRWRVELRLLPGPLAEPAGDPVLLLERFQGDPKAALERFAVVDLGTEGGPSDWRVEGAALIQVSETGGGAEPELPGTVAVTGDPEWTDYRLGVDLRSDSGGALGVVFRWVDGDNHYRLSLDAGRKYRRLIKREKGVVSILWEEETGYAAGETLRLAVEAVGSRLTGYLGNDRLFEVTDTAHAAGRVGLYASGNPDARWEAIEVRRPSLEAYALFRDRFAAGDLAGWGRIDEAAASQPSGMEVLGGELILRSFVQQENGDAFPGTYAYAGSTAWTDAVYSARLLCHGGEAIGLIFRGRDLANYYRFSMDAQRGYRRLVKKVNGVVTVLWQDAVAYTPGQAYELAVVAVGSSLQGFLDGAPLFAVEDGDVPAGRIALYAWNNPEARFSQVRVLPADRVAVPAVEPVWTTWYAFGGEERLPAGARVRVFSGPEAGAPPGEGGVERRFAAPPGEMGRPRFPATGAELRVVGPEGPGHARTFVPFTEYILLPPPQVLRRADGTGLVVVPFGGSPLVEGQYRLSFSYDRERTGEVHPFSQAGDRTPERVAIDIPWEAR